MAEDHLPRKQSSGRLRAYSQSAWKARSQAAALRSGFLIRPVRSRGGRMPKFAFIGAKSGDSQALT